MKMEVRITPLIFPEGHGLIELKTEILSNGVDFLTEASENLTRTIIDLQDKAVRESLIALSWTPPPTGAESGTGAKRFEAAWRDLCRLWNDEDIDRGQFVQGVKDLICIYGDPTKAAPKGVIEFKEKK